MQQLFKLFKRFFAPESQTPAKSLLITKLEQQTQLAIASQTELERIKKRLQEYEAALGQITAELHQKDREIEKWKQTHHSFRDRSDKIGLLDWLELLKRPIQVTQVETFPQAEGVLWGYYLNLPRSQTEVIGGSLVVRGWILGKQATATKLQIYYRESLVIESEVNKPRPQIARKFPDIAEANTSGFEVIFSVVGLPETAELEVAAVLADDSCIRLGKIFLSRIS